MKIMLQTQNKIHFKVIAVTALLIVSFFLRGSANFIEMASPSVKINSIKIFFNTDVVKVTYAIIGMKYIIPNFPPEIKISCNIISSKKVVLMKNIIEKIRNKKFNQLANSLKKFVHI